MSALKEIYVMARQTKASPPPDAQHFYDVPDFFAPRDIDRVFISCTFTWDKPRAEDLACAWQDACGRPVLLGGPAYGDSHDEFIPGRWLKPGITITTRGCPGCDSPCLVPRFEGPLQCLKIKPGHIVQDNNLLAAPQEHIEDVLFMLDSQSKAARFVGGLEARRLLDADWFVDAIREMRVGELWLSYDSEPQRNPALEAILLLRSLGFPQRKTRCYVLVGRNGDSVHSAEKRLTDVFETGGLPFAMLWHDEDGKTKDGDDWKRLVRKWSRPAAMFSREAAE